MMYLSVRFLAGFVISAMVLSAQAPAGQAGTGAGGGQAGAPGGAVGGGQQGGQVGQPGRGQQRFPTSDDQRRDPFGQQQQQQMQMTLFLSGKVVMDDGTPPPEPVVIERVCNGMARPEGYTDSKGRFSFQLGQNTAMLSDASVSTAGDPFGGGPGGMMGRGGSSMGMGGANNRLLGCELRASLPGFRSELVDLSQRRYMDNPDVGTIILRRLAKVDGFTFSATTAFAPKDAKKAYEKGREAAKKQKWADAEKEQQKAVAVYPKFAAAWYELGFAYQQQSKVDDALKAYEESLKADAKFISPYAQLTRIAASQNKWEQAADYAGKAIKLNPYISPDVYFLSGVANYQIKHLDNAEEHTREALKLDAQHRNPKISHLLGVILAEKRDIPGAAEAMRDYLKFAPNAKDADNVKQQLAELEKALNNREGAAQAAQ